MTLHYGFDYADTKEDVILSEENQQLVQRFIEEFWNQGKMEVADICLAPNFVAWDEQYGPEGFKKLFHFIRAAFPDLHFSIEDCFAVNNKVAIRVVERGTHQGEWQGIPPTGKRITVGGDCNIPYCKREDRPTMVLQ